jgi:hypothetical protein
MVRTSFRLITAARFFCLKPKETKGHHWQTKILPSRPVHLLFRFLVRATVKILT